MSFTEQFYDFNTSIDLGGRTDFGFGGGSGFSPTFGGFGSQPTPTNQAGFFGNLTGRDLTTGLLGGLNAGIAGVGAQNTAAAANAAAEGQLKFLNAARREALDAQIAQNQFNTAFTYGPGADLNFFREDLADQKRRFRDDLYAQKRTEYANSPEARQAAQFQNRLAIKRDLASRIGQTAAMFGSAAPVNVSNLVV